MRLVKRYVIRYSRKIEEEVEVEYQFLRFEVCLVLFRVFVYCACDVGCGVVRERDGYRRKKGAAGTFFGLDCCLLVNAATATATALGETKTKGQGR
jgi:hypothetical protein